MADQNNNDKLLVPVVGRLLALVIGLVIALVGLTFSFVYYASHAGLKIEASDSTSIVSETAVPEDLSKFWKAPDEATLEGAPEKEAVLYGKDLIVHTADYFGHNGKIRKNASNGMNCQNCHLDAGTKVFGNNYSAVASTYPKYRARSGAMENMYKRINDCFERSLNGKALDTLSREMQAIVAYINWLGKDVAKGNKPEGSGFKNLAFLDRAANPASGKIAYELKCQSCHALAGEGVLNTDKTAFVYPPLWGKSSYNDGAGLYRMSNFARYIKYNMPLGASHNNPQLSDEEAWDIAAYVNTQPRPHKNNKLDWPNIEEKPFDHPFGPYADGFSKEQHKFGPFQPIVDKIKTL